MQNERQIYHLYFENKHERLNPFEKVFFCRADYFGTKNIT